MTAVAWVFARELQPNYLILRIAIPDGDLVLNDGTLSPRTQKVGDLPCSVIDTVQPYCDAENEWVEVVLCDGYRLELEPDAECEVVTK